MKILLCLVIVLVIETRARPSHPSLKPEEECLEQLGLQMRDVLPYVHIITDLSSPEIINEFFACAWKKRNMLSDNHNINGENIAIYVLDIYASLNLNEDQKQQVISEMNKCGSLTAEHESTLGLLIKNCIIEGINNLEFLAYEI
ncbi:hypothetical protein FQA39_LY09414 [Lamprigera yunnana]|nr:hypothetical protein FQA39_LY09414 [Lamprigera yunnana]